MWPQEQGNRAQENRGLEAGGTHVSGQVAETLGGQEVDDWGQEGRYAGTFTKVS